MIDDIALFRYRAMLQVFKFAAGTLRRAISLTVWISLTATLSLCQEQILYWVSIGHRLRLKLQRKWLQHSSLINSSQI